MQLYASFLIFSFFFGLGFCSYLDDQVTSNTAPAHLHATWASVYTALLKNKWRRITILGGQGRPTPNRTPIPTTHTQAETKSIQNACFSTFLLNYTDGPTRIRKKEAPIY